MISLEKKVTELTKAQSKAQTDRALNETVLRNIEALKKEMEIKLGSIDTESTNKQVIILEKKISEIIEAQSKFHTVSTINEAVLENVGNYYMKGWYINLIDIKFE